MERHEDAGPSPDQTTDIDRLAEAIDSPEDMMGMATLWRAVMTLPHWWFVAVGEEGEQAPAMAVDGDEMLMLAFTSGDRAHDFAVQAGMVGEDENMAAIAMKPHEVVESAQVYADAGIDALVFDNHITSFGIPTLQLPKVWEAVTAEPEQ